MQRNGNDNGNSHTAGHRHRKATETIERAKTDGDDGNDGRQVDGLKKKRHEMSQKRRRNQDI